MAEADFFLPAVFSLDSANVQAIESSATDPKVRMDSTGLFVTDAAGTPLVNVDANGVRIDADTAGSPSPPRSVEWVRGDNGAVVARVSASARAVQAPYPNGGADSVGVNVSALAPRSFAQAGLSLTAPDNQTQNGLVNINASDFVGGVQHIAGKILLRSDGYSDYLTQLIVDTGQIAGPNYLPAGWAYLSGPVSFNTIVPTILRVTLTGLIQHNGVAGATYEWYTTVNVNGTAYYLQHGFGANAGTNQSPGPAGTVDIPLAAGGANVGIYTYCAAGPAMGMYSWRWTATVTPRGN